MKLSFDKFERYELPQVILCNPNSRATEVDGKITITDTVGVLSNPKGMNLKLNFNAPHELSFDYYLHKSTDPIKQSFYDSLYESIQTDRYIYLTDIGYFIISNTTDSDEDNIDKKSINCKSCEENELAIAEGLYLKEGTYYLHTDNNDGLLDLFLPKTAGWTMGCIDPSLLAKPYFVEETEVDNGYNFLYTTIQNMFECIVEPDIIKRTISVYSRVYYAENHLTDIHIAKYNLLKHKTVEENDEDKYTALNVQGKDENLEIRAVNPTGKNIIYNFKPRYSCMSSALQQAIEKWQEKRESVEEEYLTLQQSYYTELEKLFNEEQDIEVLKGELKTLEETRDAVIITVGDQQSTALDNVNAQISAKQTEINTATSAYNSHKETVHTNYEVPINQINADCALDITAIDIDGNTIFTTELLNELMTHIKPTDYVDEYMLVTESMTYPERFEKAKELMDRAQSQLVKISSGQKTYSIDTRSFLFNKQFKHFSEQLCAGAIIYVETKSDTMEQLHLTGIGINFDDKSTNFTLGNKYDRSDLKALYEDALGQNSKSFSELKYIASIIEDQQKQLDYQRNWVADLRTLTLDNVLTSEDQAIEINNRGLIGRKRQLNEDGSWATDENDNPLFELEQVKLINNTLVFTADNWKTAATAVGKVAVGYNSDGSVKYSYGINGQVLIGELILGNNLVLTGTGAGIKIKDNKGNDAFYADENGNLVLSGTIFADSGKIAGWDINSNMLVKEIKNDNISYQIYLSSNSDYGAFAMAIKEKSSDASTWTNNFYVTNVGYLYAKKANISGTIAANSGTIGGWNINATEITSINSSNSDNYIALRSFNSSSDYLLMATDTSGVRTTAISKSGTLYAKNAVIEGSIIATSLTLDGATIPYSKIADTPDLTIYITKTGEISRGTVSEGSRGIKISTDGLLQASNAIIYGTIYASSGKIAGWSIGSTTLGKRVYYSTEDKTYLTYMQASSNSGSFAFAVREASGNYTDGSDPNTWSNVFYVTNTGYFYAQKATIKGNITATSGVIGAWEIDTNGWIKSTANGVTLSLRAPSDGTDWSLVSVNSSGVAITGIKKDGTFYGKNVDIAGKIIASSGTIGGWDIGSTYLETSYGSYRTGMQAPLGNTYAAFYAGCTSVSGSTIIGNANFYVRHDGYLYANNATIKGTLSVGSAITTATKGAAVSSKLGGLYLITNPNGNGAVINTANCFLGDFGYSQSGLIFTDNIAHFAGYNEEGKSAGVWVYGSSGNGQLHGTWTYADSSSGSLSDINHKNSIEILDDKYDNLFNNIQSVRYKYNEGTSNRYHLGYIAQQIEQAVIDADLTEKDAALVIDVQDRDENGIALESCTKYLRYEEFISLNTWQIQKLKSKVTDLETTVTELKTQIQTLTAG